MMAKGGGYLRRRSPAASLLPLRCFGAKEKGWGQIDRGSSPPNPNEAKTVSFGKRKPQRTFVNGVKALLQLLTDLPDFLSLWEGVIPEAAFEQKLRRFHHLIGGTWLHSLKWVPLFWRKERGRAAAQHILLATALVSFPSCLRRGVAEFVDGIPEVKTNPISLPCFPLRGT